MKNWTINKRIFLIQAILLGLLLTVGFVAVVSLQRLEAFAGFHLRDDAIPGIVNISEISTLTLRGQVQSLYAASAPDAARREQCFAQAREFSGRIAEATKAYETAISSAEDRNNLELLKQRGAAYLALRDEYFVRLESDSADAAGKFYQDRVAPGFAELQHQIDLMLKWNESAAVRVANDAVSTAHRAAWIARTVAGVSLVVAVILGCVVIRGINRSLRHVTATLKAASGQLSAAAGRVSVTSQSLAEGSSEQAASLEETSAALEEIDSMTKRNADGAENARALAQETAAATEAGMRDMGEMVDAMTAIKSSSDNIAKIIKTIEEIAFQTNILALNAAVEAARAGEAGAGFAVVADEVRALAQRAAQAAKETAERIDDSIGKSGRGVEISARVAQGLKQITERARRVSDLVVEIATASREQAQGLGQINTAIAQMDKVTQNNAASAEESAASAEELNAQALTLNESVGDLLRLVGGAAEGPDQIPGSTKSAPAPSRRSRSPLLASGSGRATAIAASPIDQDQFFQKA